MIQLLCRCFIDDILRYILIFTLLVIHCMDLIFVSHCFFQWGVKTSSSDRALWSSPALLFSYKLACQAVHNKMKTVPTHFDKTSSLQVYELTSELTNCSSVNIKTFFFKCRSCDIVIERQIGHTHNISLLLRTFWENQFIALYFKNISSNITYSACPSMNLRVFMGGLTSQSIFEMQPDEKARWYRQSYAQYWNDEFGKTYCCVYKTPTIMQQSFDMMLLHLCCRFSGCSTFPQIFSSI